MCENICVCFCQPALLVMLQLKANYNPSFSPIRPQQRGDITISPLLQQGQMNPRNSPNHTHTSSLRLNHCTLIMQTSLKIHCYTGLCASESSFVSGARVCVSLAQKTKGQAGGRDFRQPACSLSSPLDDLISGNCLTHNKLVCVLAWLPILF